MNSRIGDFRSIVGMGQFLIHVLILFVCSTIVITVPAYLLTVLHSVQYRAKSTAYVEVLRGARRNVTRPASRGGRRRARDC